MNLGICLTIINDFIFLSKNLDTFLFFLMTIFTGIKYTHLCKQKQNMSILQCIQCVGIMNSREWGGGAVYEPFTMDCYE